MSQWFLNFGVGPTDGDFFAPQQVEKTWTEGALLTSTDEDLVNHHFTWTCLK